MQLNKESKINALKKWFVNQQSVLVAFSGGVDSTLLTKIAFITLGDKALAVTSDSASLARNELVQINQLVQNIGIRHIMIKTNEFSNTNYLKNPENRCYYCKQELFDKLNFQDLNNFQKWSFRQLNFSSGSKYLRRHAKELKFDLYEDFEEDIIKGLNFDSPDAFGDYLEDKIGVRSLAEYNADLAKKNKLELIIYEKN